MDIGSKLVSSLGSPSSFIPLAVKDLCNTTGYTYFSYNAGGSIEAKDRFVDEVGTGFIWLGGIPFYKKLIDKTLYESAKISPDIDVRIVKDKDYLKSAIQNAPNKEILSELKKASTCVNKVKYLAIAKFLMSMGLTMLSYLGLTKLKQKMTRLNIEKEFNEKRKQSSQNNTTKGTKQPDVFAGFKNFGSKRNPSFGSKIKTAEEFMLNPVKNMVMLDVGISGERLSNARTNGEFKEYAIKEGSFLFFVYFADKLIKQVLENISNKFLKMPISFDAQFLSSNLSEDILKDKKMQQEISKFNSDFQKNNSGNNMFKFLLKNQNNTVVKAAEYSGIIETIEDEKGNKKIDTRKYIDFDKMKQLSKNLELYIQSGTKAENIKKYLNKIRGLKIASTMISIGTCCFSLGYMVPKYMYKYRQNCQNGNSHFHVKTEYEKELASRAANAA